MPMNGVCTKNDLKFPTVRALSEHGYYALNMYSVSRYENIVIEPENAV